MRRFDNIFQILLTQFIYLVVEGLLLSKVHFGQLNRFLPLFRAATFFFLRREPRLILDPIDAFL